jgi:mycothiol synthase
MLAEITKENRLPDGFTTRPATMDDIEAITELLNACAVAYTGKPDVSIADMTSFFTTPGFDLATSTRLTFAPDGKLVGYSDADDTSPVPVKISVWGRTHPDYEGLGIGSTGIRWAEARARQTIPRLPEDARVVMTCHTLSTVTQAAHLLQDNGMSNCRHFWQMVVDLEGQPQPTPRWPTGITLTSFAELNDLATLFHAEQDAFKDHWGYVEEPEEEGLERFRHWVENDEEFEPGLWYLAMAGEEIAGFALCRRRSKDDEEMGMVNVLGVRRPWRKQGLGLALLHHSFNVFQQRGKKRAGLFVDADNLTGATRLYEKAGMHVDRQIDEYEKVLRDGTDLVKKTIEE